MDSKRIKLIVKFFERVFQNTHSISSVEMSSEQTLKVNWSQLNCRENATYHYSNIYQYDNQKKVIGSKLNDFPIQIQSNISVSSPERTYRTIVQQVKDKTKTKNNQVIEVYQNEDVIAQVNLADHHEQILNNELVGTAIRWNKKETKFLYLAQAKSKPTKSYFEMEEDKDLDDVLRTYKYEQDFGEGLNKITKIQLFEFDLEKQMLYQIEIPENIVPTYPQYLDEQGEQIIIQGYKIHPEFKYGILHCYNRESDIYLLSDLQRTQLYPKLPKDQQDGDKQKTQNEKKEVKFKIISQDEVCFKPITSPDGKKIAYLGAPLSPPHLNYLALKVINTSDWSIEEILPIKKENLSESGEFMGVCGFYDDLEYFFWLNDNEHFVLTTVVGHTLGSFILNTKTKQIGRFNVNKTHSDEFQIINYDLKYNTLFATHINMTGPQQLAFLKNLDLTQDIQTIVKNAEWQYISLSQGEQSIYKPIKACLQQFDEQILKSGQATGCLWKLNSFNKETLPKELNDLFENNQKLNPINQKDEERPLVVFVHGGPHSSSTGLLAFNHLYFLLQGYCVLLPNYTGSAGYGQDQIDKLLTNIGDIDAKEIIHMIDQVVDKKLCDPKKIIIMGGSYGGYMTAIMSSRYSDKFLCGIQRNPALNIPFMLNITDIPDWCVGESFGKKMDWNLSGDDYKKMFELSPISLPNKVPTLNLLGGNDRRVPYQQSLAYHAQTIFNGTEIETYIYPESDHALKESLSTIFDVLIKQVTFIEKHLLK